MSTTTVYPSWHSLPPPPWTPTSHEPYAAEVQPAYNNEACLEYNTTGYAATRSGDSGLTGTAEYDHTLPLSYLRSSSVAFPVDYTAVSPVPALVETEVPFPIFP